MLLPIVAGFILILVILFGCTSLEDKETSQETSYDGAVYQGSAMGYRGLIHVYVSMENGIITGISVDSDEDGSVGGMAIDELTDIILMYNTTEIDAISGATETSLGFLSAVENAIMQQ